jgi:hypothetical protein
MRNYDNHVMEKEGEQVLVGHCYHHPSGDLLSDPVLASIIVAESGSRCELSGWWGIQFAVTSRTGKGRRG